MGNAVYIKISRYAQLFTRDLRHDILRKRVLFSWRESVYCEIEKGCSIRAFTDGEILYAHVVRREEENDKVKSGRVMVKAWPKK